MSTLKSFRSFLLSEEMVTIVKAGEKKRMIDRSQLDTAHGQGWRAATTKVGSDPKGKLHELLVGYHLTGKHMKNHKGEDGKSPNDFHSSLYHSISDEDYNKINERAKKAAAHIKAEVEKHGHSIDKVDWTSKAGDLKSSTGIEASQKDDASDIVIHTKDKNGKTVFHGVSLKVTDKNKKHLPVSNPGMSATLGADKILDAHRENILEKHPELKKMTAPADRKVFVKGNPDVQSNIKKLHLKALHDIVGHTHDKLKEMSPEELKNHLFTQVLQANKTPMEKEGHFHIRHTTYESKSGQQHHALNPSDHYKDIVKDPKKLTVEKSDTSIIFKYDGKPLAKHRMKFESQSDPLSSVKGSGEPQST